MGRLQRMAVALGASYGAGLVGYLFVGGVMDTWYAGLVKPPFMPPEWVFFPVWLILYALMGLSLGLIWGKTSWSPWIGCFFVSLAFNAAWTMFFFGFHSILIAFIDIVCLAFIVMALTLGAWDTHRRAAYLLLPYLIWILFAAYLNAGIWFLN